MATLRERLIWQDGTVHDGPRRYLMLRPDVLMGALVLLDDATRQRVLEALQASAREHGGASLRAYAGSAPGDGQALIVSTVAAAADLGWGQWHVRCEPSSLTLEVTASPFAAGWLASSGGGPAGCAVCAPIAGLFSALAALVLGADVLAKESRCMAQQDAGSCFFIAHHA